MYRLIWALFGVAIVISITACGNGSSTMNDSQNQQQSQNNQNNNNDDDGNNDTPLPPELIYATAYEDGEVIIYDATLGEIVDRMTVGETAYGVAVSPDGSEVWATDNTLGKVIIFDSATRQQIGEIGGFVFPTTILFSNTNRVFISEFSANRITVVDQVSRLKEDTISTDNSKPVDQASLSEDGRYALFPGIAGGQNSLILIDTQTLAKNILPTSGSEPKAVVVKDNIAYVTNSESDSLDMFVGVSSGNPRLCIGFENPLPECKASSYPIAVPGEPQGMSVVDDKIVIAQFAEGVNSVVILDLNALTLSAPVPTGARPWWTALLDDGSVAVANNFESSISIIDPESEIELRRDQLDSSHIVAMAHE